MITFFQISILASFAIFLIPKQWKYLFVLILHTLLVIASIWWAIQAFGQAEKLIVPLGVSSWSGEVNLVIDRLSSFFLLIINIICLTGIVYGGAYLKPYIAKKRTISISLHFFSFLWLHAAMILVVSLNDGLAFLLGWELMSLFSFILVIFEGEKESTLKTGINYLLQMHLGFALIMFGFLILVNATGEMSFDALTTYFSKYGNVGLFLVFFAGFGIKAGFIPLHTWLPRAHPAAPSHVSGVMSGVMIKMGIYGILRVTTYLQHDFGKIGSVVLIISILSGIVGVILAIMQHDLKRLLAYHSIENIGIIGIGIGISILGASTGDAFLVTLGMCGALLHTLNHALFKSLLFFSTGNIYYAGHTVNMDNLGGAAKQMRITSIVFLVGALAISGIPPFNGFISEFLIYSGLTENLTKADFSMSLAGLTAFVSLVIIGGLCLYCFTKAFGLTFLGTPRRQHSKPLREAPFAMLLPVFVLIGFIVTIGFFSGFILQPLGSVVALFGNLGPEATVLYQTKTILHNIGLANGVLLIVIVGFIIVRRRQQSTIPVAQGPTWGCGYSAGDHRHQYTPTSYAESLRELATPVIASHNTYKSFSQQEIFPPGRKFKSENLDRIEHSAIIRLTRLLVEYLPRAGFTQTGVINHYLIYPLAFLIIFGLLTFLNYI